MLVGTATIGRGTSPPTTLASARQCFRDLHDLFDAFPLTEHDLGKTEANRPVVVDFCETEVFEGQGSELFCGVIDTEGTALDPLEDLAKAARVHSETNCSSS